jgi:hypothetical protein
LAAVGAAAVQAATGTFVVLFVLQVICIQPLARVAVCGVHVAIGVGPVVVFVHVVAVQLLPALAACGTQVPTCTAVWPVVVLQLVCWCPLALVAATGVHDATGVGPLTTVGAGQVVVV